MREESDAGLDRRVGREKVACKLVVHSERAVPRGADLERLGSAAAQQRVEHTLQLLDDVRVLCSVLLIDALHNLLLVLWADGVSPERHKRRHALSQVPAVLAHENGHTRVVPV